MAYPYCYLSFNPTSGTYLDSAVVTIQVNLGMYSSSWSGYFTGIYDSLGVIFYDSAGNSLGSHFNRDQSVEFVSFSYNGTTGTITIDLSKCDNSTKLTAAYFALRGYLKAHTIVSVNEADWTLDMYNSDDVNNNTLPKYNLTHYTACGAPTSVKVNNSVSTISTTGSSVTLSWSGASGGTNNSISSYRIFYTNSTNGSTWDGWYEYTDYPSTSTSGSLTVNLGNAGTYRKFGIATVGSAGDEYGSAIVESPIVYRQAISACGAPTSCSLSSTLSTGNVTLSWSGASAGTSNSITGYKIQRCESSNGSSWGSWADLTTVSSTSTSASLTVSPPSTAGNYYKYRVLTMGSAGSSYYSGWFESSNSLRRDHAPLTGFTDDPLTAGTSLVKALHMQELQSRVSTLRTFYGLGTYNFTTIIAGTTSLAGWTTHVNQIRLAIEEVCTASKKTHETWIPFSVNCPRADIIQQLRNVILAL